MIVVDTNILSYFFLPSNEQSVMAQKVYRKQTLWVAPVLWRSEFRNVLALYMRRQQLPMAKAQLLMQQAESLMDGLEFEVSSAAVISLVAASNCTAYDCEFVALAHQLKVPLVTYDKKILREFPETAVSPSSFLARPDRFD